MAETNVQKHTDQAANDSTQVEDDPEDGDELALVLLVGVAHHDGALGTPEQTGADTQQGTREDEEPDVLIVVVREQRRDVDEVAKAAKGQGQLEADAVGDATGQEADHGEGAVQGGVGVADVLRFDLATSPETADGVEHAGAQEADEGDDDELGLGGGEPRERPRADLDRLVHPRTPFHGAGVAGHLALLRGVGAVPGGFLRRGDFFVWCRGSHGWGGSGSGV